MEMDLSSSLDPQVAFDSQAITSDTTTNGNIIDSQGYESLDFSILSATLSDGTYTAQLQHGDDSGLSDASVVASDDYIGDLPVFADTEDNAVKHVGYVGKKRYVRLNIVSASTTSGGTLAAIAIRGNAKSRPTLVKV